MLKQKLFKVGITVLLCGFLLVNNTATTEAASTSNVVSTTFESMEMVTPRFVNNDLRSRVTDTKKPTEIWDINANGTYYLDGNTKGLPLFTLYKFKGAKQYTITIKNYDKGKVNVYTYRGLIVTKQATIDSGKKVSFTYEPGSSTKDFYLGFKKVAFSSTTIDVSGSVKKK